MKAEREPKVLFIGDSHSAALLAGARLLGIPADGASWSGSAWHDGRFFLNENGISPRGLPKPARLMSDLRLRLGREKVVKPGQPVVSTMGFHLGRLVPPYGWNGHEAVTEDEDFPEGVDVTSRAFLRDYIAHHRGRHLRVARRWARQEKVIFVAPPPAFERPSYRAFREEILRMFREGGLTVFDPLPEFANETDGLVPDDMMEEDGLHGSAEYGARVLRAMIRDGLLDLALPEKT